MVNRGRLPASSVSVMLAPLAAGVDSMLYVTLAFSRSAGPAQEFAA
jgi:hypothetical protein